MTREELGDAVVTLGIAAVVGAVVLAVALPVAVGAAIIDAVLTSKRPERVVLVWDEP